MNDLWNNILEFSQSTTTRIGKQLMQDFGRVQADSKADGSLVTKADKWADNQIRDAISTQFPNHGILSEENNTVFPDNEWCWIVDPLDGTTNFTRGIPIWCISLGLLYKGSPVFGYVYAPPTDEAFYGYWQGDSELSLPSGAFCNHRPIKTSDDNISKNHFFNVCSRSTSVINSDFPCKIRMLGVASYNFLTIATGAVLGAIEGTPKVWDIAGAWVILQAAGGCWISLKSQPFPLVVGEDYSSKSLPTLAVSKPELIKIFKPLVD
ncbi:inositol monophosphatase family protein [Plectonema cf. radiosum LEGE 06105]|uniref:inositol-phosphate phosphatase n=1 Tax=Plectonema cf. radiosum LEGE 06105 TaxID=945769 RepID=A0A8J7EWA3_9CYAN|nr:inositol monophosphatase family protein [Plectonema radiosum]MBE9211251.1 inositol monophosphatase family protein [Plectonema cf. radiosum LEGE 06105]